MPQWPPPCPPPRQYAPPAPPPRRQGLHPLAWLVIALTAGTVIAVAALLAGRALTGSGGSPGYNDPAYLAQSVKQQAGTQLAKNDPGVTVTRAQCEHASGTSFTCVTMFSDGTSAAWNATVAADGSSYVASRAS